MNHKSFIRNILFLFLLAEFLPGISRLEAQQISIGKGNVIYICPDSTISAIGLNSGFTDVWGGNYFRYQLGDGTDTNRSYPVKVKGLHNVTSVNAIGSMAVLSDGSVWKWTRNNMYDLHKLDIDSVAEISVGMQSYLNLFYCALKKDGSLWLWGENAYDAGPGWDYGETPEKMDIPKVKKVVAGQYCVIALCEDGSLWTWGYSQVDGNGNDLPEIPVIPRPSRVQTITDVIDIGTSIMTAIALKSDGTVWEWGWDVTSIIGHQSYPVKLNIENVKSISTNFFDALLAIKNDGTLWEYSDSTISNTYYGRPKTTPGMVSGLNLVESAYSNGGTRFATDMSGNTYRWGDNNYGQLGNFTTFPVDSPELMPFPCVAVNCDTITKNPDAFVLDTSVQAGIPVTLRSSPSDADLYWWYPRNSIITGKFDREATVSIKEETEFTAVIMDTYGCMRKERFLLKKICGHLQRLAMDSVTYPGAKVNLTAGAGKDYVWNPADGLSCTQCNQVTAGINNSVTYTVFYTDIYNCPVQEIFILRVRDCDTIIKNYNVLALDTLITPGTTINLEASAGMEYRWNNPEGLSCNDCRNPSARIYANTEFSVTISDDYNCQWVERFRITNNCDSATLTEPVLAEDTITYPDSEIPLIIPLAGSYSWDPPQNLSCTDCANPVASVKQSIQYIATVVDSFNCMSKMKFRISVRNCDTIVLQDHIIQLDTIADYRTEIQLTASPSTRGYLWSPNTGLSCSDCYNPTFIARNSIEYQARIYDPWRCPLVEVFKIEVIRNEIVIPNVFTPNGDNINDYFEIKGLAPGSSLKIYDEQGRLKFTAENYDGRWNGFDSAGNQLPEGTYWYVLEITDYEPFKGWVYLKK